MNSFQTELFVVSFEIDHDHDCNMVNLTKKSDESYNRFGTLRGLAAYIEDNDHQFGRYEAARILEKAARWILS